MGKRPVQFIEILGELIPRGFEFLGSLVGQEPGQASVARPLQEFSTHLTQLASFYFNEKLELVPVRHRWVGGFFEGPKGFESI